MKVLSLREPFASLIAEEIKGIETRSWRTHYRGEVYIHASLGKVSKKDPRILELISMLDDKEMKYGYIIAKCKLVDCIYMDEAFLRLMEKNSIEKKCGGYSEGRYAWVLEDVEILPEPIPAKGQLGIWNYEE